MNINKKEALDKDEKKLIRILAESFLASGYLVEEDFNDESSLVSKVDDILQRAEIIPVVDHTKTLLENADKFMRTNEYDLSIIMYATYFEHELNKLIENILSKQEITNKSRNELIRSVNISGKCSWLLEVIGLPKFNLNHMKVINEVSSERNSFVHYKWNPMENYSETEKKINLISRAKRTSTYMKQYSSKNIYSGKKGSIKKALTKRSSRDAKKLPAP